MPATLTPAVIQAPKGCCGPFGHHSLTSPDFTGVPLNGVDVRCGLSVTSRPRFVASGRVSAQGRLPAVIIRAGDKLQVTLDPLDPTQGATRRFCSRFPTAAGRIEQHPDRGECRGLPGRGDEYPVAAGQAAILEYQVLATPSPFPNGTGKLKLELGPSNKTEKTNNEKKTLLEESARKGCFPERGACPCREGRVPYGLMPDRNLAVRLAGPVRSASSPRAGSARLCCRSEC